VQKLIDTKQITKAGLQTIETAKQNGSWTILDEVEKLIIPKDLETELKTKVNSMDFFLSLSRSTRKAMLQWLVLAKREETRQKRIIEIVKNAEQGKKPKQF
jgi:uncharacterized protein YdeI (YjbR/CyaY-like superfamily)